MKVVILAAGYAVRLQPLTLNTSKPLLTIGGRTIIDRILQKVEKLKDVDSVYVVTNAKFFRHFEDWLKALPHRDGISIINDGTTTNETRLGAIRDLEFAISEKSIDDDLLVIAGDNIFDFELDGFLDLARATPDGVSVALHDIKSAELARNFGVVKIGEDNRITDFEEKPEKPKSTLISTGIYYFPKNKLSYIGRYVKMLQKLDAPGYYIGWLGKVDKVYGYAFLEDWYDIGSIDSYKAADKRYLEKESKT